MYYEVYLDVLFLENLWMDLILLRIAAMLCQTQIRWPRILLSAVAGSLGACLLTVGSGYLTGAGYFTGTLGVAVLMVWIIFPGGKGFWYLVMYLYVTGFLFGGLLRYLNQFYPLADLTAAGVSTVCGGIFGLIYWIRRQRQKEKGRICQVLLQAGNCRIETEALLDTGNSLYDPMMGKPVSILSPVLMQRILGEADKEMLPHLIPYRTISQEGFLKGYLLDSMEIRTQGQSRRIERPVVACMPSGKTELRMILHCDLLSS